MTCRADVKKLIYDDIYNEFAKNRYTIVRVNDNTFRIANQQSTKGKSRAEHLRQATLIANEIKSRIYARYGNNIDVNIEVPYYIGFPVEMTIEPIPEYIETVYAQVTPEKRTEFLTDLAFTFDPALYQQELMEDSPLKMIPYEVYEAQEKARLKEEAERKAREEALKKITIDEKGQYRMFSKIGEEETQILTEDVANDLFNFLFEKTGLSGEVINDKSQKFKGAVIEGVPTINVAYAELSDGFHEYLHPVIMSLRISNPQLFNKLYDDLKKLPQWEEISDRALKRVQKFYPELKNVNDFKEEVLVTALGYAAELKSNKQLETVKANRPFFDWANNFYKWLTGFLNGLFTNTVDLSKVGLDTTLENLVEWITDTKTKILLTEDWQNLANMSQGVDNSLEITEADNLNTLENSLLSGLDRKDKTQTLEDYISDWVKTKFKSKVRPYKPKKYDQQSFVYQEAQRLIAVVGISGYEFSKEEIKNLPEKTYQELAEVIDQLDLNFRFSSWLMSKGKTSIALNSPFKPDNTPAAELKAVEIFRKELQDKYPNRKSLPADELAEEYTAWAKENYGLSVTDAVGHVGYGLNRLLIPTAIDSNYTRKLFLDNYIVKSGHNFKIGKNITGNGLGWYASVEVNNDGFDHEFQSDILPEISKSYKKDEYKSTAYQLTETSSEDLASRIAFQKVAKQINFSLDSKLLDVINPTRNFEFTRSIDDVQKFLISELDVQVNDAKIYGVIPQYLTDWKIASKLINTLKAPKSENYKQLEDWIKKYIVIEQTDGVRTVPSVEAGVIGDLTEGEANEVDYLPFSKEPERQFITRYSTVENGNQKEFTYYLLSEGFDNLPDFIQIEIDRQTNWHNSNDPLKPLLPGTTKSIIEVLAPGRGNVSIYTIYPVGATKIKNYWQVKNALARAKVLSDSIIEKTFNRYRKAKKIIRGVEFRKKLYQDQENIIQIKNYWKDQYERYLDFFKKEYEFVKQEAQNQISEKSAENREVFYEKYVDIYKKWFDITIQHSINTRKLQGKTYYYLPTAEAMEAIEGNTIAAPLYRTTFEVDKEKQTVKGYLVKYIQQNTQETTNEIKKYWSQISTRINQESTVSDIADALMGNTDFVTDSEAFKEFVARQDAWYAVNKPTVGPFYSALSKFAKKNNIKLSYEKPDWSKTPLVKVDISEYDYKPIDRFSKLETTPIKPGVPELFESNPQVADEVYRALGFKDISKQEELLTVEEKQIPGKEGESFSEMQRRVIQNINIKKRLELAAKNNIVQGKSYSFRELKKIFNDDKLFDNEIYQQLNTILESSNLSFKFGSLNKGKLTINGYYNSNNNSINIDTLVLQTSNLATSDFKRILLHEIIHAATFINLGENAILTNTQKTALNNLNNLIQELRKDRDFFAQYGLTNANEMLAELANSKFVDKLKNKKFNDSQNFFEKIISEIVKLLGLKTTAYDIVKESFDNLVKEYNVTTQITPEQKQQALQLYSDYLDTTIEPTIEGFKEFIEQPSSTQTEDLSVSLLPTVETEEKKLLDIPDIAVESEFQQKHCK